MFASKAGTYLSEGPFRFSTLEKPLALPINVRLGWKGTNTLAYFDCSKFLVVKSFTKFAPDDSEDNVLTIQPGNTNRAGRLSTLDLLIKEAYFVKQVNSIFNIKIS
jgi:hypothetical protein